MKIPPSIFGTVIETKNARRTTYFQPPEKYKNYLPIGKNGNFSAIGASDWIAKSGRTQSFNCRTTGLIARPDKSTGLPREILATETFEFLKAATSPNQKAVGGAFDTVPGKTIKRIVNWSPTSVPWLRRVKG